MELSRREALCGTLAAFGTALMSPAVGEAQSPKPPARTRPADEPFGYCLNTSTIRGNKLDIVGVDRCRVQGWVPRARTVDERDR